MTRVGIGMRSIKTGLAVVICLILYSYIPLTEPILAVLVAISSIQNNIDDSVTFSKNRLIGTFLGTVIGIIYTQIAGQSVVFIAVGVIVLITLLNKLNQSKSILIAMAVFVSIVTGVVQGNPIIYGFNKFANTLLGITIGFLINYFIKPPNQVEIMKQNVIGTVDEIEYVIQELLFTSDVIDLASLKQELLDIEISLKIYNQDEKYHMAKMDKIKYVERSVKNFRKVYSQIDLIKDKRALLNQENILQANETFNKKYIEQKEVILEEPYILIYNYHVKEILYEIKGIREDLANVTQGKAIKQKLPKRFLGKKDKIKNKGESKHEKIKN